MSKLSAFAILRLTTSLNRVGVLHGQIGPALLKQGAATDQGTVIRVQCLTQTETYLV
jgi:hypothetical protein